MTMVVFGELSELGYLNDAPTMAVVMNCLLYGGVLILVRGWCLRTAGRQLGRAELPAGSGSAWPVRRAGFRGIRRTLTAAPRD
jgi:hypothetical protein